MTLHAHFALKAKEAEMNERFGQADKEWRHAMLSTDSPKLREDYRAKWMKAEMAYGRLLTSGQFTRNTPG